MSVSVMTATNEAPFTDDDLEALFDAIRTEEDHDEDDLETLFEAVREEMVMDGEVERSKR